MAALVAVFCVSTGFAKICDDRTSIDKMTTGTSIKFNEVNWDRTSYSVHLKAGTAYVNSRLEGGYIEMGSADEAIKYETYYLDESKDGFAFEARNKYYLGGPLRTPWIYLYPVRFVLDFRSNESISIGSLKYNLGKDIVLTAVCKD